MVLPNTFNIIFNVENNMEMLLSWVIELEWGGGGGEGDPSRLVSVNHCFGTISGQHRKPGYW